MTKEMDSQQACTLWTYLRTCAAEPIFSYEGAPLSLITSEEAARAAQFAESLYLGLDRLALELSEEERDEECER